MSVLVAKHLDIGYGGEKKEKKYVSRDLNLELETSSLVCLLGPNGSGKSTLLRTMAGIQAALGGTLKLEDKAIGKLSGKALARICSVVLTDAVDHSLSGYAVVAIGRYPYTGWMGNLRKEDEEKIQWAIQATGTENYIYRPLYQMSDGERQKVMIARALAQDTPMVLLDEPTAHLDLPNRVEIIRLLRMLAHEAPKAILLSTHDLDLAIQAADQIWLMHPDHPMHIGSPEDLVLQGIFQEVFPSDGFSFDPVSGGFRLHREKGDAIVLKGKGLAFLWTRRALERNGFEVLNEGDSPRITIEQNVAPMGNLWNYQGPQGQGNFSSIEALIGFLKGNEG